MVGTLVKRKRTQLGMTQGELALKTGLRQTYISQVEQGEIALPRDHNLDALGTALGISRAEFYRAAGMLDNLPAPAAEPDTSIDPLSDVFEWIRQQPDIVEDFADAKRRMTPRVYEEYTRQTAQAWASNARMQKRTWELLEEEAATRKA